MRAISSTPDWNVSQFRHTHFTPVLVFEQPSRDDKFGIVLIVWLVLSFFWPTFCSDDRPVPLFPLPEIPPESASLHALAVQSRVEGLRRRPAPKGQQLEKKLAYTGYLHR